MRFYFASCALAFSLVAASGCTMCQSCEDDTYAAYGGRWQRTDRCEGRVGSVFDPAGAMIPYGEEAEWTDGEEPEALPEPEEMREDA